MTTTVSEVYRTGRPVQRAWAALGEHHTAQQQSGTIVAAVRDFRSAVYNDGADVDAAPTGPLRLAVSHAATAWLETLPARPGSPLPGPRKPSRAAPASAWQQLQQTLRLYNEYNLPNPDAVQLWVLAVSRSAQTAISTLSVPDATATRPVRAVDWLIDLALHRAPEGEQWEHVIQEVLLPLFSQARDATLRADEHLSRRSLVRFDEGNHRAQVEHATALGYYRNATELIAWSTTFLSDSRLRFEAKNQVSTSVVPAL